MLNEVFFIGFSSWFHPSVWFFFTNGAFFAEKYFFEVGKFSIRKKIFPENPNSIFPERNRKKSPTKKNLRFPPKKKSDRKSWKFDENRSFRNPIGFWWFSENIVDFSRFSFFPGFSILILIENFLRYFSRKWWHTFLSWELFLCFVPFSGNLENFLKQKKSSSTKKKKMFPPMDFYKKWYTCEVLRALQDAMVFRSI